MFLFANAALSSGRPFRYTGVMLQRSIAYCLGRKAPRFWVVTMGNQGNAGGRGAEWRVSALRGGGGGSRSQLWGRATPSYNLRGIF